MIKLEFSLLGGIKVGYAEFLGRITICFILGIIIGFERQYRRRIAGIRTISLVALGAFLFVSVSELTVANDVSRVAAQVVSGIGFLGAGVILRDGTNIRGLNTAATLWCSLAVGTLTALGLVVEAIIGVFFILFSNIVLRFVSRVIMGRINPKVEHYVLKIECLPEKEMIVKNLLIQKLKSQDNVMKHFTTKMNDDLMQIEVQIEVLHEGIDSINSIINRLCIEQGISSTEFTEIINYVDDDDDDYDAK